MLWIALIVLVAIAAGVLGTLLELALWAVLMTVVLLAAGGALLARAAASRRSDAPAARR